MSPVSREHALAELASPATPPARLAEIVGAHPDLAPYVRAHPACYPDLAAWIDAYAAALPPAPAASPAAGYTPESYGAPASGYAPDSYGMSAGHAPAHQGSPMPAGDGAYPGVAAPIFGSSEQVPVEIPGRVRKPRARGFVPAVAAVCVAVLAVGAAATVGARYVLSAGFSNPGDSAVAVPASAFEFIEVALEPTPDQLLALKGLLENLPGTLSLLEDEGTTIDAESAEDAQAAVWDGLFGDGVSEYGGALDFHTEVAPWIGRRIAIASIADAPIDVGSRLYAFEATDVEAGAAALRRLVDGRSEDGASEFQIAVRGSWVIVAHAGLDLEAQYAAGALADVPAFRTAMGRLGDPGLLTVWASPVRIAETAAILEGREWTAADEALIDPDVAMAATIAATSTSLELRSIVTGTGLTLPTTDLHELVASMPDSSVGALGIAPFGELAASVFEATPQTRALHIAQTMQAGAEIDDLLTRWDERYVDSWGALRVLETYWGDDLADELEWAEQDMYDQLGITSFAALDDELGSGVAMAIDSSFDCFDVYYDGCTDPGVTLAVGSDSSDTSSLLRDLSDEIGEFFDSSTVAGDGVTTWRAGTPDGIGTLADSSAFARAVPASSGAIAIAYVDVSQAVALANRATDLPSEARLVLDDLEAIGISAHLDSDGTLTSVMRITVSHQ